MSTIRHRRGGPNIYYVLSSEQFPAPQLVEYGAAAERAGFEGIWTSDHFQPWQANEGHSGSAWITLAALTQQTSSIMLGTGVTCPTFRYRPAIVAQAWATLSLFAPGRIFLGVGSGENLNEGASGAGWAAYEERASRLVEAVKIIRELWKGKHVRTRGRFWKIDGKLYDPPSSKIPLYIAAGGPKSARLAGRYGDGLITSASALKRNPGLKAAWEGGVREEGRDPDMQPIIVEHWVIVGDKEQARGGAKKWQFIPKAWKRGYFDNISPEDIQARAVREVPLDKVLDGWTVSTDSRVHIGAIEELAGLGVTHVVVHVPTPNQREVIEFFGRKVLPALRTS